MLQDQATPPPRTHANPFAKASSGRKRGMKISVLCLLALGFLTPACQVSTKTGKDAAGLIGQGIVNNPSNKSLRFDMLKFGLGEFCRELLEHGAPLRLADGQPVIGRYFGDSCAAKSIDNVEKSTIIVQFGGQGYAWTAGTGRLGFRAQGLLELAPDFRIHDDAMYVFFRPVQVDTSDFELLMTEHPLAQAVADLVGIDEQALGKAIIQAQLGRGFTAIRYDADGHTDFALGLVDPGDRPFRPYTVLSSPRTTEANGRTELFAGQQDFVGRIHVGSGEKVTITLRVEGTDAIDFALLSEASATPHLEDYLSKPGSLRARTVPSFLAKATSDVPTRAAIKVPEGSYFLVLDHSPAWGDNTPEANSLPARIDYLIQTGAIQE